MSISKRFRRKKKKISEKENRKPTFQLVSFFDYNKFIICLKFNTEMTGTEYGLDMSHVSAKQSIRYSPYNKIIDILINQIRFKSKMFTFSWTRTVMKRWIRGKSKNHNW